MEQMETIAAIATSSAQGGISVIRLSGPDSLAIVDRIYQSKNGNKRLSQQKSHTIHYGFICDGSSTIDEVIVMLMMAPNSYTREDVVEIDCHGGNMAARTILDLVCQNGARLAEPGEFTKRAFLNGRIDLTQAEAVVEVIQSKNRYALESSVSHLKGKMKQLIQDKRESIKRDIAFIEAALDDPEHITLDGFSEELDQKCQQYEKELNHLLDNCENGRMIMEGIRTAIVGKPNVGKSSLLNLLLQQDRAIVTNVPGTTRDYLEADARIGGLSLRLIDTAGIHETEDFVEKIGIDRAMGFIKESDFIIIVLDSSTEIDEEDLLILKESEHYQGVILLNKTDLETRVTAEHLHKISSKRVISFSAINGQGLSELEDYMKSLFYEDKLSFNDEIYISNLRQKTALIQGIESIGKVRESISLGMSEDFLSIDLVAAYEELGKIIGETMEDDIIDTIFREFCMGK